MWASLSCSKHAVVAFHVRKSITCVFLQMQMNTYIIKVFGCQCQVDHSLLWLKPLKRQPCPALPFLQVLTNAEATHNCITGKNPY